MQRPPRCGSSPCPRTETSTEPPVRSQPLRWLPSHRASTCLVRCCVDPSPGWRRRRSRPRRPVVLRRRRWGGPGGDHRTILYVSGIDPPDSAVEGIGRRRRPSRRPLRPSASTADGDVRRTFFVLGFRRETVPAAPLVTERPNRLNPARALTWHEECRSHSAPGVDRRSVCLLVRHRESSEAIGDGGWAVRLEASVP